MLVPYQGVERAGGDYASAVEWPSVALSPECTLGYLLRRPHGRRQLRWDTERLAGSIRKYPAALDGVKFGRATRDHKRAARSTMPRFGARLAVTFFVTNVSSNVAQAAFCGRGQAFDTKF